jgi:hypothetical protein
MIDVISAIYMAFFNAFMRGLSLEVSYEVSQLTNPNSLLFIASDLHNH